MFKVQWVPIALNRLAAIWLQATDRNAITQAANAIDQRLEHDPEGASESREEGRRILFEAPLGVLFRIDADKKIVYVLNVWQFHKRP